MGLTVRRKTARNLAVRRKNERILTVSRKKNVNREVKHDVYGKRQKLNFCRLSSALCTVESKYLYLL